MTRTPGQRTAHGCRLDESLLSALAPFADLTADQRREILARATPRRVEQGAAIFDEGAPAERFYLLLDGYIRVVRHNQDGDQVIMLHIPAGQLFGIAPALGRDTYPATAIAAAECLVLSWPAGLWHAFGAHYPGFVAAAMKTLGLRAGEFNQRLVEMATLQVERRVAHVVLRLANQAGRRTDEGIEIAMPVTRQDLSEMTGSTLHTISRLLSGWEKRGWVRSGRRRIVVTEPHQLVLLSEGRDHGVL